MTPDTLPRDVSEPQDERGGVTPRDASEGKGPQRRPQRRLGRRLEGVAKRLGAVTVGYKLALAVRGTVAGRSPDTLEGGGCWVTPLPFQCIPG